MGIPILGRDKGGNMSQQKASWNEPLAEVIDLNSWKQEKNSPSSLSSYQAYLKLLDVNELLNELNFMTNEIQNQNVDHKIILMTQSLIQEVAQRTTNESPFMYASLKKMEKSLTKTLVELE
jgi:hypothetical protein